MIRARSIVLLTIAAAASAGVACDREPPAAMSAPTAPPTDLAPPEGVSDRFVARVREISPDAQIAVLDRRRVVVDGGEVDLANMGEECRRAPAECDAVIERWARVATDRTPAVATRAQVRAVLLPLEHVAAGRARATAEGRPDPFTGRPFVGPLFEALVIDWPDAIAQLGQATRASLGEISQDDLHALARDNMRAAFATELPTEPFGPAPDIHFVATGDSYENSRVLLHERWAAVAQRVRGDLLVAAPARDVVIYTGSASEVDVATLRWLAQLAMTREPHPIAPAILRWTPAGWELFHANDRPDPAIEAAMRAPRPTAE